MSSAPADHSLGIKRLVDEGFEVVRRPGYLILQSIPYVTSQRTVAIGTLVTELNENLETLFPPTDHQVWFAGEFPCHQDGTPLEGIRNDSTPRMLWDGFEVHHHFSNKPRDGGFPDYYSKMLNYVRLISHEAMAIDPACKPQTHRRIPPIDAESVFHYHDTASSRADIVAVSARLGLGRVAIVGLGGTGSYVLDLVAKTPVLQLHLFDGDALLQHNAFRAPGAVPASTLDQQVPKVTYFAGVYGAMRKGIVPHAAFLTDENIQQLDDFDFVFLCVDKPGVRKLVSEYLISKRIPFVDVGMDLRVVPGGNALYGSCRTTLCTPNHSDHFSQSAPVDGDPGGDVYAENIQVAPLNALNAAFAVIKWQQHFGYFQDLVMEHNSLFSINSHSLTREEMPGLEECG